MRCTSHQHTKHINKTHPTTHSGYLDTSIITFTTSKQIIIAGISQHPFDTVVLRDAALASGELDLDIDIDLNMDIELDMEDGAGTHPSPIVESEASIHEDDELIDIEDVVLEYKGIEYPCNAQTLMQGSKVLSETLQDYDASQFRVSNTSRHPFLGIYLGILTELIRQPQVFNVPTFSECGSPEAFYATLEVCYSGCKCFRTPQQGACFRYLLYPVSRARRSSQKKKKIKRIRDLVADERIPYYSLDP